MTDDLRIESVADERAIVEAWGGLAIARRRIFSTPEWMESWWRHLAGGEERRTFVLLGGGDEPIGVLPLAAGQLGPARVLRFAGHGPADCLGPVCASDLEAPALKALARSGTYRGYFLAERMPSGIGAPSEFTELQREDSPLVDIGDGWDAYLKGRSSNFRSQLGRKERKLRREHGLIYRLATAGTVEDDMRTLFRLHGARWGDEASSAFTERRKAFHLDFAARAQERGWLRLWTAEVEGGQAVAAWYGFRFAGEELYYQSGRDPEWDRSSVGLVMLGQTIRAAAEDGIATYRMLRGGESYKDRFATGNEPVVTMATARSRLGRASIRLVRSASAWAPARRALSGLRG